MSLKTKNLLQPIKKENRNWKEKWKFKKEINLIKKRNVLKNRDQFQILRVLEAVEVLIIKLALIITDYLQL